MYNRMKSRAYFILASVMAWTLVIMMYLPLVLVVFVLVLACLGEFIPYHPPAPTNDDLPMSPLPIDRRDSNAKPRRGHGRNEHSSF